MSRQRQMRWIPSRDHRRRGSTFSLCQTWCLTIHTQFRMESNNTSLTCLLSFKSQYVPIIHKCFEQTSVVQIADLQVAPAIGLGFVRCCDPAKHCETTEGVSACSYMVLDPATLSMFCGETFLQPSGAHPGTLCTVLCFMAAGFCESKHP